MTKDHIVDLSLTLYIITVGDIDAYITISQLTQIITTKQYKRMHYVHRKTSMFFRENASSKCDALLCLLLFLLNQMQDLCQETSQDKQNFECIFMYIRLEYKIRRLLHLASQRFLEIQMKMKNYKLFASSIRFLAMLLPFRRKKVRCQVAQPCYHNYMHTFHLFCSYYKWKRDNFSLHLSRV